MMIMPELKLAFIHIYKTGGTSLTQLLAPHTSADFRRPNPLTEGEGFQATWHFQNVQHSKFKSNMGGFPPKLRPQLGAYRFLAVVRNPYTWVHSLYQEFFSTDREGKMGANFLFGQVKPGRTLPEFYEFVEAFMPGYSHEVGLGTQFSFVDGVPWDQLTLIRFENYEEELRRVLPGLGVSVDHLPHALNRGDKKKAQAEALMKDRDYVRFVNRIYAEDFRAFGYPQIDA